MTLIDKAKAFAKERHAGQTRKYSGEPYSQHLRSVVQLLDGYGVTAEPVLAAAWLHDTVEDTPTTMQEILQEFRPEVAELVYWMTDTEEGDNHTRPHDCMAPGTRAVGCQDDQARRHHRQLPQRQHP